MSSSETYIAHNEDRSKEDAYKIYRYFIKDSMDKIISVNDNLVAGSNHFVHSRAHLASLDSEA